MDQCMKRFASRFYCIMTTIITTVVFVSCSSLQQSSHVSAKDSQTKTPKRQVQSEWVACKTHTDCIKVKSFCKLPASIHRDHKDSFLTFVKQNEDSTKCSRYKNMKYSHITEAVCENNQCQLIIP